MNTINESDDSNKVIVSNNVLTTRDNNSWMLDNNSSTSNNSRARICTFSYSSSSSSSLSFTSTSYAPTYDQRSASGRSNKSWKKQKQYSKLYRDRSQTQVTSVTDPVPSSTTAEDNAPAYDGPDLTPVKFRRMKTFNARQNIIMAAAQHEPAKMILDSDAGISGVGEQWKLTDISRMSSMSIQGAFGDSMRPSIQGLLPTRFHYLQLNISMDSMADILSLVSIDYRTHLTSRTIHVSKLLLVTVCFYLNHPVAHW